MSEEFTTIQRDTVYKGRVFNIERDEVRHQTGYESVREVVRHNGGAVIVALFENRDTILIRQYRYPVNERIYELPAGKLAVDENPLECARRELEEETGLRATKLDKLGSILTTPGFCSEELHIFLATDLRNGLQRLEQGEETIQVFRIPLVDALYMCSEGIIHDGKTISGLTLAAMKAGIIDLEQ